MTHTDPALRATSIADFGAGTAMVLGLATLIGYGADWPMLVTWGSASSGMSPTTAVAICLIATGVLCANRRLARPTRVTALVACAIGAAVL